MNAATQLGVRADERRFLAKDREGAVDADGRVDGSGHVRSTVHG
jgi:hypothetical protein